MASTNVVEHAEQFSAGIDIAGRDPRRIEFRAWSDSSSWGDREPSLVATIGDRLHYEGDPLVEVALAQAADPCDVASVLRKMADVLEGPCGRVVMNLPQRGDEKHSSTVCGVRLYSH